MESIGKLFTFIMLLVVNVFVSGLLVLKAFNWFIVPLWGGVEPLTYGNACGLALAISLLSIRYSEQKERTFGESVALEFGMWIVKFVLLLFAWICYLVIY